MSVDLERLDAAIAYIEAHPERWSQGNWFRRTACGTTCCLAGTIAVQAGWQPTDWGRYNYGGEAEDLAGRVAAGTSEGHVYDVARGLLGIQVDEAHRLFASSNNLADLKRIRDELAAEVTS